MTTSIESLLLFSSALYTTYNNVTYMHETIINMIILTKSNCLNCVREVTVYMEAFKATPNKDVVPFLRLHHV